MRCRLPLAVRSTRSRGANESGSAANDDEADGPVDIRSPMCPPRRGVVSGVTGRQAAAKSCVSSTWRRVARRWRNTRARVSVEPPRRESRRGGSIGKKERCRSAS